MKMTKKDKIIGNNIAHLQGMAYEEFNVSSAPFGQLYVDMVKRITDMIIEYGYAKSINHNVLDYLEEVNAHMACQAAKICYIAGFQYIREG